MDSITVIYQYIHWPTKVSIQSQLLRVHLKQTGLTVCPTSISGGVYPTYWLTDIAALLIGSVPQNQKTSYAPVQYNMQKYRQLVACSHLISWTY